MKNIDLNYFKQKLEKKQEIFDIPNLPDSEWSRLIKEAREKSVTTQNKNLDAYIRTVIYALFASKKLSAILTVAVLLTMIFSYSAVYNSHLNSVKRNNITDNRSSFKKNGAINVSVKSFI